MRLYRIKKQHIDMFNESQIFFVQSWYSLMHRNSLDSHRVRCMNSVNIINELYELIKKKDKIRKIEKDISFVANEAIAILESDEVIKHHFRKHFDRLIPLLKKWQNEKKNKKNDKLNDDLLEYYIKDFISDVENEYLKDLFDSLHQAIFIDHNQTAIFSHTNSLLSFMIDKGQSMATLFSVVTNILCKDGNDDFIDRFAYMKERLSEGIKEYSLTFRLTNFSKFTDSMNKFGSIDFFSEIELERPPDHANKFLSKGLNVVFAQTKAKGRDAQAAGIHGKQQLDNILDLIRFELEANIIDVDNQFLACKTNDSYTNLFKLPSNIPNPQRNINSNEFSRFLTNVDYVLSNSSISSESRKKVTSALRFYRMGRDTAQYENKFLNWWTALEYLIRTGDEGSIISEVEEKLTNALLLEYANKLLKSYISACSYCGVKFGETGIQPDEFYTSIQDNEYFEGLIEKLKNYPLLCFSLKNFQCQTKEPKQISNFINRHERHLRWHLNRLWRMRCDIVHSAEYTINITLLSANLEYYLKTTLWMVLKYLRSNPNISSLDELFSRINYMASKLKETLSNEDLTFFKEFIQEKVNRI